MYISLQNIKYKVKIKMKGKRKKMKIDSSDDEHALKSFHESNISEKSKSKFVIKDIDKLSESGINISDIKKLKLSGYYTISSILMATKRDLCSIKGISDMKIEKIMAIAMKIGDSGFQSGLVCLEKRKSVLRISTGSEALDNLLMGGIESRAITEAFGEFRTGKTQLCHTIAVTAQLSRKKGGGEGKVIYIDSEGTFRPEKILAISKRYDLDPQKTLDNIIYGRVYTTDLQTNLLTMAAAKMMEEKCSLIIIDSIMALFRVDYLGRGRLSERQQVLNKTLSTLMKLAEQFNVAIFLTNQVMSNPSGMTFVQDPKKPIGGHVLAHASTTRLFFRKGRGEERICKVYDSPSIPEGEAVFLISDEGVTDPD